MVLRVLHSVRSYVHRTSGIYSDNRAWVGQGCGVSLAQKAAQLDLHISQVSVESVLQLSFWIDRGFCSIDRWAKGQLGIVVGLAGGSTLLFVLTLECCDLLCSL